MAAVRKLLLIGGDLDQQRVLLQLVKECRGAPFDLELAVTYEVGLKKLVGAHYAACLLEYHLGARDGFELLREARQSGSKTPVIVLTANDSEEADLTERDKGAADYLSKAGLTPRLLERALRYALKLDEALSRLSELAQLDELTNLFNRRELQRILSEEWDRSVRFERPFSLVMVDIDHFKVINDTHGHQVGDEVIRHVSSLLAGQVRNVDRVARYGGEEFALVMVETDLAGAVYGIRRLGALLAETPCIVSRDLTIEVTLSAGVATSQSDASSVSDLIHAADMALYAAKNGGRNRIATTDGKTVLFDSF